MYIGLGNNRALHILPDGSVLTEGLNELPAEAYFMLPLVVKLDPENFSGPGGFDKILQLEESLGSFTGRPEDVYERIGPILASKGITAERVAKVLLEMSPIQKMRNTNDISKDKYNNCKRRLIGFITDYYPGSSNVRKQNANRRNGIS